MAAIVILADDLSGAADCGIGFVRCGLEAVVCLGDEAPEADVVCVDADTRRMSEVEAAAETARLLRKHLAPAALLYKKIDSTLRGHVAAEVAAALAVARETDAQALAIAAPAFPATGRTTRGGRQYLNGVPVEETEPWRGLAGRADLIALFQARGLTVELLPLQRVRDGDLPRSVAGGHGLDALVCDAETETDLQAIANAGTQIGRRVVWVGSGGLSRHLPAAFGLAREPRVQHRTPVRGPLLFVVGSRSRLSRLQAERVPDASRLRIPARDATSAGESPQAKLRAEIEAACAFGRDVVVRFGDEPVDGPLLCAAVAHLLAPQVPRFAGLVLTGGETARALLQAVGVAGLRLLGETEPGVVLATAASGALEGQPVVTKSGAFGTPDTLRNCQLLLHAGLAIRGGMAEGTWP